jgi:serine/threonine protein phosphatase PrpC
LILQIIWSFNNHLMGVFFLVVSASKSVICTPEVVNVPLKLSQDPGRERTQRFVLASDGLWDVVENDDVGKAAARHPMAKRRASRDDIERSQSPKTSSSDRAATSCSPKVAAAKILQACLEAGGNRDDITICVVDISCR